MIFSKGLNYSDDFSMETLLEELNTVDEELGVNYDDLHDESYTLLEFLEPPKELEEIDRIYKYSDRFRFGFVLKNFDLLFSNLFKNVQSTRRFQDIRPNLLKIVDRSKTLDELDYISRDARATKVYLRYLAKTNPKIKKQCEDHIKWLSTEYKDYIKKKRKELKEKGVTESNLDTFFSHNTKILTEAILNNDECKLNEFIDNINSILENLNSDEYSKLRRYMTIQKVYFENRKEYNVCTEQFFQFVRKVGESFFI